MTYVLRSVVDSSSGVRVDAESRGRLGWAVSQDACDLQEEPDHGLLLPLPGGHHRGEEGSLSGEALGCSAHPQSGGDVSTSIVQVQGLRQGDLQLAVVLLLPHE